MKYAFATCVAKVNEWGHSYLLWLTVSTIKDIFVKWWFSTSSVNTLLSNTVENSLLWQTNTTCHSKLAEVLFLFLMRLVGWQIPQCWMTASTVSAASNQDNSQCAFKEKTLGGDGVHMERNTLTWQRKQMEVTVINKTAGKTKIKEKGQSVCAHVRDLLSEQLAAHATPQLGPGVVAREHRSLGLSRQVLLVQATVLLQTAAHRVQVHIGYQNLRHPRGLWIPEWYLRSERGEAGVKGRWLHQLKSGFRKSLAEKKVYPTAGVQMFSLKDEE